MSKYRSAELIQKKRKDFWVKISLFFIAFVLTILCLSELSKFHFVNIKKINIEGNKIIETSVISDIASKHLDGNFLWFLFSKRNAFLYKKNEIIKDSLNTHPRIKNINLNLKNFSVLNIKIEEREPFAFWCEKEEGDSLVENCFVVDKDGFIFDKSRGEELFKYYSESDNKKIGLSVFDSEKFRLIFFILGCVFKESLIISFFLYKKAFLFEKRNHKKFPSRCFEAISLITDVSIILLPSILIFFIFTK